MGLRIVWVGAGGDGREELFLQRADAGFAVVSDVVGGDSDLGTRWDVRYSVDCDEAWRTRRVAIQERTSGRRLELHGDGDGNWVDARGVPVDVIAGCVDIDFRATPFSNTLPIRRLGLSVGESVTIDVAYIDAPGLEVSRERQVYTRLDERRWRFEQPGAHFAAVITVDEDGLVVDYPGLFRRIA